MSLDSLLNFSSNKSMEKKLNLGGGEKGNRCVQQAARVGGNVAPACGKEQLRTGGCLLTTGERLHSRGQKSEMDQSPGGVGAPRAVVSLAGTAGMAGERKGLRW